MKIKTFEEKLLKLGKYRKQNNSNLDTKMLYDLFCFVKFGNKILHSFEIFLKSESTIKKLNKSESIEEFLKELNYTQLNNYNEKDVKKMEFYVYLIPRNEDTKKDYFLLNSLKNTITFNEGERANWVNVLKRINKHISKNYIIYSILISIILIIFTSINYLIIYETGVPLNRMDDLNILFSIYAYYFFTIFLIPLTLVFDLFQKIIESRILFSVYSIYFFITIFSLRYIISVTQGYYKYISIRNSYLPLFMVLFKSALLSVIFGIMFIIIAFIYSFIYDFINVNNSEPDKANSSLIFNIYHNKIGYPKIMHVKKNTYILVHKTNTEYIVYDFQDTISYVKDIDTIIKNYLNKNDNKKKEKDKNVEKFCRNINTLPKFKEEKIIYEILAQSPVSKPINFIPLNIKDIEDPQITPYNFKALNLKYEKIVKDCNKLLETYK
ncbi:hypothetical protein [Malaciobacter canalis]|uniref:hypothetical protein n=1 Tax=Malaciobacter canalis TaxID=1912871 RepID=UPI00384CDD11